MAQLSPPQRPAVKTTLFRGMIVDDQTRRRFSSSIHYNTNTNTKTRYDSPTQVILSIGCPLDEPFGFVCLKSSNITPDIRTLKGKKIGYVGEFGKISIDELTSQYGVQPSEDTVVRCGMHVSPAIIDGSIDAGNRAWRNVQMVELEEWLTCHNRPKKRCPNVAHRRPRRAGLLLLLLLLLLLFPLFDSSKSANEKFISGQPRSKSALQILFLGLASPEASRARYGRKRLGMLGDQKRMVVLQEEMKENGGFLDVEREVGVAA